VGAVASAVGVVAAAAEVSVVEVETLRTGTEGAVTEGKTGVEGGDEMGELGGGVGGEAGVGEGEEDGEKGAEASHSISCSPMALVTYSARAAATN
jgi:hypothetical protein